MIELDDVTKTYPGGVQAVRSLSLRVDVGETLVLVGTSGSGKTTALKMINRLIEPSSGRITVEGREIREWNPIELRRHIGYVIQSVGLLPHMTVAENVSIVPRLLGGPKADIRSRAAEVLAVVGLEPDDYASRYPQELSGGQQQRVGVARALAADPPIILMDEPFGALDPITRSSLQHEFLDLKARIRKTIVFVTHDISEAVILGDRIAVMHLGMLQQVAPPGELIARPQTGFVSEFLGRQRLQLRLDAAKVRDAADTSPDGLTEAKRLMSAGSVRPDDALSSAIETMAGLSVGQISVTDADGRPIGVLRKDSVLRVVHDLLSGGAM